MCVCVCVCGGSFAKLFLRLLLFLSFVSLRCFAQDRGKTPILSGSGDDPDLVWPENICCRCPEGFVGGGRCLKVSIFQFSEVSS